MSAVAANYETLQELGVEVIAISTDTHFSHSLMQEYCNRPANFDQLIINQWRNTVQPQDVIFHLGDVVFGMDREKTKEIINELPGTKILIRGNHDKNHSNNWFIKVGFSAVLEKAQTCGVILSHMPAILREEEIKRGIINVHGHYHNAPPKRWERELVKRITRNHYLLILEDLNYRPVLLEDVRRGKFVKNTKKLLKEAH